MLASTRRTGDQLAVLFFDLDRFKAINDIYGHSVGDQLLQAVAQRLRESFREADLIARLGGDEFIAVLTNLNDADDAARAARNAIAALTPPYPIADLILHCVPSLGISLFPQDGDSIELLIQGADHAMYHAKQISPGGYQFVTEALNQQAHTTLTLETRLREALSQQEFRLAYQPLLDPHDSRITGVEALLRGDGRSEIGPMRNSGGWKPSPASALACIKTPNCGSRMGGLFVLAASSRNTNRNRSCQLHDYRGGTGVLDHAGRLVTQLQSVYSRVIRNFMRDRVNQRVLGIFAYCLVVLRTICEGGAEAFVPSLAVSTKIATESLVRDPLGGIEQRGGPAQQLGVVPIPK